MLPGATVRDAAATTAAATTRGHREDYGERL
jgi:hypothetical protein